LPRRVAFFLQRGFYLNTIPRIKKWNFVVIAKIHDILNPGESIGYVLEGTIKHRSMVPFSIVGQVKVLNLVDDGLYKPDRILAKVELLSTKKKIDINMIQTWPVKKPINFYQEKLLSNTPLVTKVRIVDALFPIAEGGTACIPGPFGSGKTVFQQSVSKFGEADVVIVAACGERAGEVVETLREFPEINIRKQENH
jgi:V/A-type H+-transporting ATPase subunit A